MMRRLDHPNVVRYVESVVEGQELRIVMEYACGGDLHARIGRARAAGRHFSEGVILAWFVQIVLALKHCHQNRLLHRDLKVRQSLQPWLEDKTGRRTDRRHVPLPFTSRPRTSCLPTRITSQSMRLGTASETAVAGSRASRGRKTSAL